MFKNLEKILALSFLLVVANVTQAASEWRKTCPNNYNNAGCILKNCTPVGVGDFDELFDDGTNAVGLLARDIGQGFSTCVNGSILDCCDPVEVTVICAERYYYSSTPCGSPNPWYSYGDLTRKACNGRTFVDSGPNGPPVFNIG